jgi:UTP--glucose-1-phosphate uridylyltransferase
MNSFNTHAETRKIVQKYRHHRIDLLTFKQSKFPRISKESLLPLPTSSTDDNDRWYPPGHGNVFEAILNCGLLDELLAKGIEYLFISNIDNLGATVDLRILRHLQDTSCEFLMEVTDKTRADIKGGTLVEYNDEIRLLEIAQVPPEHRSDFTSVKKFKIFNTNNLWVSTRAIRRLFDDSTFGLDVIVNEKTVEVPQPSPDPTERNGNATTKILQLETAAGAAIKHFPNSRGVVVPRSRFLPVKSCSDLFLVHSDLYSLSHGSLIMNPKRQFATVPLVKLGDHFKKVSSYLGRFAGPPKILELDHLTVSGDVTFGKDVVLKGTVIVVANHGCRIDIPSGAVLDDKVVSGSLRILDH